MPPTTRKAAPSGDQLCGNTTVKSSVKLSPPALQAVAWHPRSAVSTPGCGSSTGLQQLLCLNPKSRGQWARLTALQLLGIWTASRVLLALQRGQLLRQLLAGNVQPVGA